MEICLLAATSMECNLIEAELAGEPMPGVAGERLKASGRLGNHWVDLLISGIGSVNTAWTLARALGKFPYKLLVNVGVCGAIDPALEVGQVVNIVSERFGDLGAEDRDGSLLDLRQLGLPLLERRHGPVYNQLDAHVLPFLEPNLPRVAGVTCNLAHGHEPSIERLRRHWPEAQVESLEGAAFFYAGLRSHIPFVEIRGISNRVEARDRSKWHLSESAEAAQRAALSWIASLP